MRLASRFGKNNSQTSSKASEAVSTRGSPLQSPRCPKYLTLDLWRGLACLMIVVIHAAHNANEPGDDAGAIGRFILMVIGKMGVGVPMFFVISGYCISATSDSTRRKPSAPVQFFSRRFRRIFPPYWVLALISIILVVFLTALGQGDLVSGAYGLISHPSQVSWSQWLGNLTLTETWRHHLFGDPELKIIGPSWTLCYEEQFYAVCGLLLIVAPRRFFAGSALVTLLTLAIAPLGFLNEGVAIQGFFFDGRWLMFAEGVAVYYILNYQRSRRFGICSFTMLLLALAALRWLVPAVKANDLWRDRVWELVASTAFALSLFILHRWDGRTAHSRVLRPIAICGQMCYSLYLVHWPIAVIMTTFFYRVGVRGVWPTLLIVAPLTIAASITASWIFHLWIERRFLNGPIKASVPDISKSLGRQTPEVRLGIPNP